MIETDVNFSVVGRRLIIFGVILLFVSLAIFVKKSIFVESAEEALAVVETKAYKDYADIGSGITLAFWDSKGKHYSFNTTDVSRSAAMNKNIRILYDPKDPSVACVDGTYALWGTFINVGMVGLLVMVAGFLLKRFFFF